MSIQASVGLDGANQKADVKVIQAALNLVTAESFQLANPLVVDGLNGRNTELAIQQFQTQLLKWQNPDSRVDPNGQTLKALHSYMPGGIDRNALLAIMAKGRSSRIDLFLPLLLDQLVKGGLDTPLRQAHFLAQIGHESESFTYLEEIASGAAYEGRANLGNTEPGDGKRFKGRGLIQLTGRANYTAYAEESGLDLLTPGNETLLTEPDNALNVSIWFWNEHNLNVLADADNVEAITKVINGGFNGLEDRKAYLERARFFLVT